MEPLPDRALSLQDGPYWDLPEGWRVYVGLTPPWRFGESWQVVSGQKEDFSALRPLLFGEGALGWQRTIESAMKHDQEMLTVWTRIALALERIAANTTQSANPHSPGLPLGYYTSGTVQRTDPLTIDAPKPMAHSDPSPKAQSDTK